MQQHASDVIHVHYTLRPHGCAWSRSREQNFIGPLTWRSSTQTL